MAVLTEIHFLEIRPSLKVGKYLSLRQGRTKIHNPFISVIPDDLEHALDDWGDGDHARKHFFQSILPISSLAVAAAQVASNIARRGPPILSRTSTCYAASCPSRAASCQS